MGNWTTQTNWIRLPFYGSGPMWESPDGNVRKWLHKNDLPTHVRIIQRENDLGVEFEYEYPEKEKTQELEFDNNITFTVQYNSRRVLRIITHGCLSSYDTDPPLERKFRILAESIRSIAEGRQMRTHRDRDQLIFFSMNDALQKLRQEQSCGG